MFKAMCRSHGDFVVLFFRIDRNHYSKIRKRSPREDIRKKQRFHKDRSLRNTGNLFLDEIKSIEGQVSSSSTTPQTVSGQSLTDKKPVAEEQNLLKMPPEPECVGSSNVVNIKNRQLWIRKRLPNGALDQQRLFVIKGISWSPATMAPDTGPNPLNPFNPSENVPYGFFF